MLEHWSYGALFVVIRCQCVRVFGVLILEIRCQCVRVFGALIMVI
jgi:hypothetical protein